MVNVILEQYLSFYQAKWIRSSHQKIFYLLWTTCYASLIWWNSQAKLVVLNFSYKNRLELICRYCTETVYYSTEKKSRDWHKFSIKCLTTFPLSSHSFFKSFKASFGMMMMKCFFGMVDRRKVLSLIFSRDDWQRFSPSKISNTKWKMFGLACSIWVKMCSNDNHCTTTWLLHII